jgi:long-chain acyl-CoA synthetase
MAERIGGYYLSIAVGSVMNFAESPETVPDNLREAADRFAVPRIWEKFYSAITIALKDATPLQRWMYRLRSPSAALTDYRLEGETPPLHLRLAGRRPTGWCSATSAGCSGSTASASPSRVRRRSRRT